MAKKGGVLLVVLAFALAAIFAFQAGRISLFSGAPSGWDYFYHERVVSLSIEGGRLLPFDPLSVGGRTHTYLPFFYSLIVSISLGTGISPEMLLRASSPFFLFLSALAIFFFSGKRKESLLALAFFCAFPEIIRFSSSSGMPSVASLFPLSILVFSGGALPAGTLALVALSLGALHQISALSFFAFAVVAGALKKNRTLPFAGIAALLVPALWALSLPSTVPTWGRSFGEIFSWEFSAYVAAPLSILLFDFMLSGKRDGKIEGLVLSFSFLSLSLFSPILPSRFLLYLGVFLALALSKVDWKAPAVAVAILALLISPTHTLRWIEPILQEGDKEALFWISSNVPGKGVLGHTDLTSVFLLGRAKTVIDGYSEGVPDAYERQEDIRRAYSSGDFSEISGKYNMSYLYTNKGEGRLIGDFKKPDSKVFSNGYAEIFGI